jgi:hypothetical protein
MRQSTALQIKRGNPRQLILELQLSCTPRSEPVRYFSRMGFGRTVTSKFMASERKMSREPPSSHARISSEYAFTDSIKMVLCPSPPPILLLPSNHEVFHPPSQPCLLNYWSTQFSLSVVLSDFYSILSSCFEREPSRVTNQKRFMEDPCLQLKGDRRSLTGGAEA